ncbi:MAG: hypothetical protein C4344_03635, partial [Acidimicrobiia bacterium]
MGRDTPLTRPPRAARRQSERVPSATAALARAPAPSAARCRGARTLPAPARSPRGGWQVSAPVFLIGAQRSGTTWLQCLLGAHPRVATPQEPEFFTGYVAAWDR